MRTRRQTRIWWWRRWNEKLKPLMTQTKIYALPAEPQPDTNDIYSIRYMRAGAQARCLDKCISGVYERVQTTTRGQFAQNHYLSLCLSHTQHTMNRLTAECVSNLKLRCCHAFVVVIVCVCAFFLASASVDFSFFRCSDALFSVGIFGFVFGTDL